MAKREETIVIDMGRLVRALWRSAWIIALTAAVCGALALGYGAFFVTPQYTSTVLMYVNSSAVTKQTITQGDLHAAQSLVETYTVILHSRATLTAVIDEAELTCGCNELSDRISAQAVNGTEVFQIDVTHPDPEEAARIANTIARVLPEKIDAIVEGSSARVVDLAEVSGSPSVPKTGRDLAVSMLLGVLISAGAILIRELLDDRVRDAMDLIRDHDLPILAQIPDRKEDLSQDAEEAYRLLRTNLNFSLPDVSGCKIIGVTSTLRGEGKSTTSLQIARTMAQTGQRVLLLEGDMRLPVMARRMPCRETPGLSNLLCGQCNGAAVLQRVEGYEDLRIITAGDIPHNPAELLNAEQMAMAMRTMAECFDVIIVDLPPVSGASDALIASRLVSGMLVVVRKGVCGHRGLEETLRQLTFTGCKLLGFVVTNGDTEEIKLTQKA